MILTLLLACDEALDSADTSLLISDEAALSFDAPPASSADDLLAARAPAACGPTYDGSVVFEGPAAEREMEAFCSTYGAVSGTVTITRTALTDLGALACLCGASDLFIEDNPQLSSLRGLENLQVVERDINIIGNPQLTQLAGLGPLPQLRTLAVANNAALPDLRGFEALEQLSGFLYLSNNGLTGLAGLEHLRAATRVHIASHPQLADLTGLNGLEVVAENALINDNPQLSAEAAWQFVEARQVDGQVTVLGNQE